MDDLTELVREKLGGPFHCYGHCHEPAELKFLPSEGKLVGVLVCPSGYVSRFVMYGHELDAEELRSFVQRNAGSAMEVREGDVRLASRHALDLGLEGADRTVLREAYWIQNYGRSKSSEPDRAALFQCSRCGAVFVQPVSAKTSLCASCAR